MSEKVVLQPQAKQQDQIPPCFLLELMGQLFA